MTIVRVSFCLLFIFMPSLTFAHGGGLDAYGCHHDRKQGGYHCHRGELAGMAFASHAEMLQTLKAKQGQSQKPEKVQK